MNNLLKPIGDGAHNERHRSSGSEDATTPDPRKATVQPAKRGRVRKVVLGFSVFALSCVLLLLGINVYLLIAERLDPSGRVYVVVDGQRQFLEQPDRLVTPDALGREQTEPSPAAASPAASTVPDVRATPQASPASSSPAMSDLETPLPPLWLKVPGIGVDVPVVLTRHDRLPREPLAGWLFKSAFPATAGNMVLLGHLDGPGAIFERLDQVRPGDEIRVGTARATHVYLVDEVFVVEDDAVGVLAPTDDAVVTLITCAGDWNVRERSYSHRLIVRGHYAQVLPAS